MKDDQGPSEDHVTLADNVVKATVMLAIALLFISLM